MSISDAGTPPKPLTYKQSGVDIEAGYEAVRRIRPHAQSTHGPEVLADIGAFGGFFALPKGYRQPVLVSGTDGVGTKLKIAFMMDRHDTVGIDVVAYCVNDILCQGAEPLFFLDYLAVGRLDPNQVEAIVAGVAAGCRQAGCALIGGETAEMPGFYQPGEYDLAGFVVGVVEREQIIDGRTVQPGDAIVGIGSTGLQSSGFSLVRRVFFGDTPWALDARPTELGGATLGEVLLTPTGIYTQAMRTVRTRCTVRGIANISGGGLPENLPRSMAPGTRARLHRGAWPVPPIFGLVQSVGHVPDDEMYRTFNMGIAMAVIVPAHEADACIQALADAGERAWVIGEVVEGEPGVDLV